jgi:hypothetical protein
MARLGRYSLPDQPLHVIQPRQQPRRHLLLGGGLCALSRLARRCGEGSPIRRFPAALRHDSGSHGSYR